MEFEIITNQCSNLIKEFIYNQNQTPENNCGYCSANMEQLTADIDELLSDNNSSIVCCYKDEILAGIAAFDLDFDRKCTEIWGPFAADQFSDEFTSIANAIIEHTKAMNRSVGELHFFTNRKNSRVMTFLENVGANYLGVHTTYRLTDNEFLDRHKTEFCTGLIKPHQYKEFLNLHDRIFPNTYYTGSGIIKRLNDYNKLRVITGDDELTGYVYSEFDSVSKCGSIEFFGVAESKRRQGYGEVLLKDAVHDLFCNNNAASVELCVSSKNDSAINLYKRAGFSVVNEYLHYNLQ